MKIALDVRQVQLLNQFEQVTGVRAKTCFFYNDEIIFVLQPEAMAKALEKGGFKIKALTKKLGKKIKLVQQPQKKNLQSIKDFIEAIVFPLKLKTLELKADTLILYPLQHQKASFIGKGKQKKLQLQTVVEHFFGIKQIQIK